MRLSRMSGGMVAMVAAMIVTGGAVLGAHPVKEYAEVLKDAETIVLDARSLYVDLATDQGVTKAAGDVVDAWGHLKAAVAVLRHGHHDGKAAAAARELADAATAAHSAYEALAKDENLHDAAMRAEGILSAVADLVYVLRGGDNPLGESCSSRCSHECGGLNVASCALNCIHGHSCEPHCCGCKDGTGSCKSCGASCQPDGTACLAVEAPAAG